MKKVWLTFVGCGIAFVAGCGTVEEGADFGQAQAVEDSLLLSKAGWSRCTPLTCALQCPEGLAEDANGCPICECAGRPVQTQLAGIPSLPSRKLGGATGCEDLTCALGCPDGFAEDDQGCPVCACAAVDGN